MTDAQRIRLYFPAWSRACAARGWRMARGRFQGTRETTYGVPDIDAVYQAIYTTAEALALQAHRALTVEDLRHACHVAALGRDKSANDLGNAELDKVIAIFKLLTHPEDLGAIISLQHPENDTRKRLVRAMKKLAPDAKLVAISKNLRTWAGQWEPPFWEDMPIAALQHLNHIIRSRPAHPVRHQQHDDPEANLQLQ